MTTTKLLKSYGPKWMGWQRYIPYPLRAVCLEIHIHPFCWGLDFHNHRRSEFSKAQANTQWFARIGCVTIAYRRML